MRSVRLRHGSLFSGLGGFDLAAEWMGWENVFHCEIDTFCQQLLNFHFPKSLSYGNIKETDFSSHKWQIDILTGGFPCQPFSVAGKRKGKEDDRHLWPFMLKAIQQIRPRWVVGENVRGIVSWNEGLVFEEVQADLEAEGYFVQPFILPAAGLGAPHRRERVWFIAYAGGDGYGSNRSTENRQQTSKDQGQRHQWQWLRAKPDGNGTEATTSNTDCIGLPSEGNPRQGRYDSDFGLQGQESNQNRKHGKHRLGSAGEVTANAGFQRLERATRPGILSESRGKTIGSQKSSRYYRNQRWESFPETEPTICCGNDGISSGLDTDTFFNELRTALTGITFPKWRSDSIKALGNAIVPQIAHIIFKAIRRYELEKR